MFLLTIFCVSMFIRIIFDIAKLEKEIEELKNIKIK